MSDNEVKKLDPIEQAFCGTIEHILKSIGNVSAEHLDLLGYQSLDIAIEKLLDYVQLLEGIRKECETLATDNSEVNLQEAISPLLNDSMLIHKTRLARSSKSRLNMMRRSPELATKSARTILGSPIEVDRNDEEDDSVLRFALEESTFMEPTNLMDVSTHEGGFLADVSSQTIRERNPESRLTMNESTFLDATGEINASTHEGGFLADISSQTIRSRNPSFNFGSVSSISTHVSSHQQQQETVLKFDLEHETPLLDELRNRGEAGKNVYDDDVIVLDETIRMTTPRRTMEIEENDLTAAATPNNLWNIKLRPGSNRKICEEIRNEVRRQLDNERPNFYE